MKGGSVLEVVVVNAVLLYLFWAVSADYAFRDGYWASMGFTPTTSLFPFALITSATSGQTSIPGLLTLDWHQVIAVILIVADALYLWAWLRARRDGSGARAPPTPK